MAKEVFVPVEWTGMKGFSILELKLKPNFPESHRIRSSPINPKLYEHAHKEFDRLINLDSNGVEGNNKQLLRHLKTLVDDEWIVRRWSNKSHCLMLGYVCSQRRSEFSDRCQVI